SRADRITASASGAGRAKNLVSSPTMSAAIGGGHAHQTPTNRCAHGGACVLYMSILYLGSDPRSLADKLADELDQHAKQADFFVPTMIVVPNRYVRKWLKLWLARRLDVAINLDFQYLEDAL